MIIDGHKKKAKAPKPPYIAADSARSKSYAKILIALGEGEVEGSANGLLDGRDILLDGVPIINPDGSRNFDVKYEFRKGSLDQDYIPAMPMVESDTNVGFALKQSTPFVRSINNTQVDQIRFRFSWPQLVDNKSNGDRVGTSVTYAIDVAEGAGSFVEYQRHTLSEKSTSKYERSYTVDLPRSPDGWRIRVRRLTADSTSDMLQNAMFVEAYTEIIDAKLTYPNTALLYLEFDAEQFPQIPKVSVRMKGRVVRVPENYNPTTRQYNGIWDGRFKWAYTNNPAWCCLDLLLSERFGLGVRIGLEQVDKWALYDIARWCDVMVPDGEGGMQPRHTLNVYINTAQDAWRILGDLASVFNGVSYWNGEQLEVQADTLRDAEYEFTMANIVDGVIEYSSIARKDKYSQIAVKYDDPDNEFQTDTVAVNDLSMTRRFGVVQSQMAAFGCTNRAEAQRKGKWALISNKYDRSATWKTGLDGYVPKVGSVVRIADNALAGAAIGGRVKLTVDGAIQLDRAPRAQVGDKLNINMPGGKSQQRTLTVVDGDMVRVDTPYTDAVQAGSQWSVDAADLVGQLFKITSIRQDSKTQFTIQGVEYNRGKFDYVDNGANIEDRPISITPVGEQAPPTNPVVSSFSYVEQGLAITNARFDWVGAVGALYYDVEWRKDNMQWVSTARTSTTGMDIEGVYTGAYEFRVRAVNAGGITSAYAHSLPVVITGKIGAPPALAYLRTVSKVMGIELQWGFPAQGAEDTALVEIHYSLAPDDQNAELLGEYSYPTDNHTLMGLGNASELYFKGRIIDRTGNIGPWSDWVYGSSSSSSDEILSYLDGKIGETQLDDFLNGRLDGFDDQLANLDGLDEYDPAKAYLKGDLIKLTGEVYAAKIDVPAGNAPPNATYWDAIGSYESLNGLISALAIQSRLNTAQIIQDGEDISVISQQVDTVVATIDGPNGLSAQVQTVSQAQAGTDNKLSSLWGVRMRQGSDGKWVNAGIGLGIENVDGVDQSQFIVDANLFAVRQGVDGSQQTVFAIENGQTILRSALIGDAVIDTANIKNLAVDTGNIKNLAVSTGKIANLAVTTGKIANLSVDTLQIADYAVTVPLYSERNQIWYGSGTYVEVLRTGTAVYGQEVDVATTLSAVFRTTGIQSQLYARLKAINTVTGVEVVVFDRQYGFAQYDASYSQPLSGSVFLTAGTYRLVVEMMSVGYTVVDFINLTALGVMK